MKPIILSASKKMPPSLAPRYDHKAITSAKRRLTDLIGLPSLAAFVASRGGWLMSNLSKILPAELARLESGGAPAAASVTTTTPAKQFIRLGAGTPAAVPTKPATAPKPSTPSKTSEFVPAKPAAKPRASGTKPEGAFTLTEARERTAQIFGYWPGFTPSQNARSQWQDLESVYTSAGHPAPWVGEVKKVDRQIGKIDSALFNKRAAAIARLFPQT